MIDKEEAEINHELINYVRKTMKHLFHNHF